MINFQPDICLPSDPAGFGHWLVGHALEHDVINQKLLQINRPVSVPSFNLLFWDDKPSIVQSWLQAHETAHQIIDGALNITSVDFSQVDLTDNDQWFEWMEDHANEHSIIRQILGII